MFRDEEKAAAQSCRFLAMDSNRIQYSDTQSTRKTKTALKTQLREYEPLNDTTNPFPNHTTTLFLSLAISFLQSQTIFLK